MRKRQLVVAEYDKTDPKYKKDLKNGNTYRFESKLNKCRYQAGKYKAKKTQQKQSGQSKRREGAVSPPGKRNNKPAKHKYKN